MVLQPHTAASSSPLYSTVLALAAVQVAAGANDDDLVACAIRLAQHCGNASPAPVCVEDEVLLKIIKGAARGPLCISPV